MVQIDKNIPFTGDKTEHGNIKYPFAEMEVGDSFLYPKDNLGSAWTIVRNANIRYKGTRKYRPKRVENGVRVWRIE